MYRRKYRGIVTKCINKPIKPGTKKVIKHLHTLPNFVLLFYEINDFLVNKHMRTMHGKFISLTLTELNIHCLLSSSKILCCHASYLPLFLADNSHYLFSVVVSYLATQEL